MSVYSVKLSNVTRTFMQIKLPDTYQTRPMAEELDLVSRIHGRFKGTGVVMPEAQRAMYEGMNEQFRADVQGWRGYPKTIRKPTVVDVGCGCGIGSNILSHEAQFVWGIDMNAESIEYARQLFERQPNNIYYTPQVTFDVVDATDMPREMMQFDYVVCIEVLEHLPVDQTDTLMAFLKRFVKTRKGVPIEGPERTKVFISTPNRNSPDIQDETPRNEHHCFEPTAGEMYEYLIQHWKGVTVMNKNHQLRDLDTTDTPLLFKCEIPYAV